jgi:hypothetical protein
MSQLPTGGTPGKLAPHELLRSDLLHNGLTLRSHKHAAIDWAAQSRCSILCDGCVGVGALGCVHDTPSAHRAPDVTAPMTWCDGVRVHTRQLRNMSTSIVYDWSCLVAAAVLVGPSQSASHTLAWMLQATVATRHSDPVTESLSVT